LPAALDAKTGSRSPFSARKREQREWRAPDLAAADVLGKLKALRGPGESYSTRQRFGTLSALSRY
jgi:hypothetical protein